MRTQYGRQSFQMSQSVQVPLSYIVLIGVEAEAAAASENTGIPFPSQFSVQNRGKAQEEAVKQGYICNLDPRNEWGVMALYLIG